LQARLGQHDAAVRQTDPERDRRLAAGHAAGQRRHLEALRDAVDPLCRKLGPRSIAFELDRQKRHCATLLSGTAARGQNGIGSSAATGVAPLTGAPLLSAATIAFSTRSKSSSVRSLPGLLFVAAF